MTETIEATLSRLITERLNGGQGAPFVWLVTELVNHHGHTREEAERAVMAEFDRSDPEKFEARAREKLEHAAELRRYLEVRKERERATAQESSV